MTEKLTPVASMVISVHHWRARTEPVSPVSVCQYNATALGIMFTCGMVLRCAVTLKPD